MTVGEVIFLRSGTKAKVGNEGHDSVTRVEGCSVLCKPMTPLNGLWRPTLAQGFGYGYLPNMPPPFLEYRLKGYKKT